MRRHLAKEIKHFGFIFSLYRKMYSSVLFPPLPHLPHTFRTFHEVKILNVCRYKFCIFYFACLSFLYSMVVEMMMTCISNLNLIKKFVWK